MSRTQITAATDAHAQATLANAGLARCWSIATDPTDAHVESYAEVTIRDIVYKLRKYGSISERQMAFLGRLLAEFTATPAQPTTPTPRWEAGRQTVEGEIASTKWYESGYGDYVGMTVKLDDGRKLWCRMPAALHTYRAMPERGARIRMSIEIQPKADDPSFALGKRPTKAALVGAEPVAVEAPVAIEVAAPAAAAVARPYLAALAGLAAAEPKAA